eukprot:CAMPEP_0113704344 /NCGR_PEP_ID=MMETSP0038_2-20120614/26461_1 /TAXON_ID=2898 /ORGANISM="Cryptomonas paramecium" /LENGTH=32 /DNA_ID=CAMNT_0000629103 /DNA_START=981 /DNA_END=1076 /DNA_ORIENTATION=+ /assembly_acc=CAM_ASM_000170
MTATNRFPDTDLQRHPARSHTAASCIVLGPPP